MSVTQKLRSRLMEAVSFSEESKFSTVPQCSVVASYSKDPYCDYAAIPKQSKGNKMLFM